MVTARALVSAAALAAAALIAAGCGSSSGGGKSSGGGTSSQSGSSQPSPNAPETNPAGDIPDNQAFVLYRPPGGGYAVKVPEGWSRVAAGGAVTFTDKLNSVRMESMPATTKPTAASVRQTELPRLARSVSGFQARGVDTARRSAGDAVRIRYLADSKPDDVTGKVVRDAVERYEFFHGGRLVVLTLSGPKGADNVDPWRIVTDSLRWTR
jgi:hypothetical protein